MNRPDTTEGYCYVTIDDGKFYIDTATAKNDTSNRIVLNAGTADHTKGTLVLQSNGETVGTFNGEDTIINIEGGAQGDFLPIEGGTLTGPLSFVSGIGYGTELPEEGIEGQLFFLDGKGSESDLPMGGLAGQALIKKSNANGDVKWGIPQVLPAGGTVGQVLMKTSNVYNEYAWSSLTDLQDSKVDQIPATVTTLSTYYPLIGSGASTTNDRSYKHLSYKVELIDGTTSNVGSTNLNLGNAKSGSLLNHSKGTINLYNDNGVKSILTPAANNSNVTNTLPLKNGIILNNNISDSSGKRYVMGVSEVNSDGAIVTANTGVYTQNDILHGAAYNDYAEYRESDILEPGRCVVENGKGQLVLSSQRLQPAPEIISDTFGFVIGETEKCKTPIAVTGRVLAYPFEDLEWFKPGDPVCAGPNGTVSVMSRQEVSLYPDRMIGTVSEIPTYETWGKNNIKVNGRIWIRIR